VPDITPDAMTSPAHPATLARGIEQLLTLAAARTFVPACERFLFLRHGQTECNARRIFQTAAEPLNATGMAQAGRAADLLAAEPIATIVCSDMPRAHTTARIAAAKHGIEPLPHAGLRERNFGALIGTSSVDIDWAASPQGGETLPGFVERAAAGLQFALGHEAPTLVVAHGGLLYVLAGLFGVPLAPALMGNAHPLRFERAAAGWRATALAAATDTAINLS
jgi:glucosyl-3-phosphoglycerate phosphatase